LKLGLCASFVPLAVELLFNGCIFVAKHLLPIRRTDHIEAHFGLEVWLVEVDKHTIGVVRLKLGVDVLLSINIHKAYASTTIVVVVVGVVNSDTILADLQ
jgi:hypothetical protein